MRLPLILSVVALTALLFYGAAQSIPGAIASSASADAIAEMEKANAQIEASRAAFDEQAATLNKTIDDLKAENLDQTSAFEAAVAERDALLSQRDQVMQRVSDIEAENSALAADKDALTQDLAALMAEIESRDSEDTTQALNDAIAAGQDEIAALQVTITELQQERDALSEQLAAIEAAAGEVPPGDVAQADAQSDQNAAALAEADERIALLTEMATVQVQTATGLTAEIEDLRAQLETLTSEASGLSDEVDRRDAIIAGLMSRMQTAAPSSVASCQEQTDAVLTARQISFEDGTATITAASIASLEDLAVIAADCAQDDLTLEIEGHTGDAGGVAANLLLSDGRAKAVRDVLVNNGVPARSVRAVGFGGSEPIADNATSEGQSQNQRIVFDWEQG
ncbi:OmpA family protein [Yoonia sp. F2084L]|uniref:OmpA family protein n=1 Tax=Yoonia sp. F2084L TaxID=2926419 RepID=UPI001FF3D164|nr:OmpA family protein [Yoonia sp. F2084L]MCK0094151.1 OmpA family protein [Yoonia sp. F2084L]